MSTEEFKKESKVTYVLVQGIRPDKMIEQRGKKVPMPYMSFIEVPFSYEVFKSFNSWQQSAICQATISKSGIVVAGMRLDTELFFREPTKEFWDEIKERFKEF